MLIALTALAIDTIAPRQSERSRHHPRSVNVGSRADFNKKPAITLYPSRLVSTRRKGIARSSAARLWRHPQAEVCKILNEQTLLMSMIETPDAVENADATAAVNGIDMLHIGASDFSTEMGIPGQ
jgi:hypothetical protein